MSTPKPHWTSNIPVIGSAVSSILNPILQGAQNRKNRKFAVERYNQERKDNISDWERQNAYNSPTEWRKRMEEAGINPFYTGQSGNNAGAVSSANTGSVDSKAPEMEMSQYADAGLKTAQTNNTRLMADNIQADTQKKKVESLSTGQDVLSKQQKRDLEMEIHGYSVDSYKAATRKTQVETGIAISREGRDQEKHGKTMRQMNQTLVLNAKKDARDDISMLNTVLNGAASRANTTQQTTNLKKTWQILNENLKEAKEIGRRADMQRLRSDTSMQKLLLGILDGVTNGKTTPNEAATTLWKLLTEKSLYNRWKDNR